MRLPYFLAVALIAASTLGQNAAAKTLAEASSPVNFPPDDFTGRSFVDNDGCVYIRAGVDGATTWVPRVTRSRQVICGQQPTFGGARVAAQPAPEAAPEPTPAPRTTASAPEAEARPQTTQQAAAAPAPQQPTASPTPVRRATPAPVLEAPQPAAPAQRRVVTASAGGCSNASGSSQPFFNNSGVRCGPQATSPSSGNRAVQTGDAVQVARQDGSRLMRIMPPIPEGYRPAWTDGRLNPFRGVPEKNARLAATLAAAGTGRAQDYDLAWTTKEPHLLYDRRTGFVVGDLFPQLVYPNTDLSAVTPAAEAAPQATVSTKRAPVAPQPGAEAAVKRHVQVATFADMAAAKDAAQRLANTGLRTRIGKYTSGGERRQVIVLGPFATSAETNRALKVARNMGFSRAIARK